MIQQNSKIADIFLGEKWKNINKTFYSMPPDSIAHGSYWFWAAHSYNNQPKASIMIPRIKLPYNINNIQMKNRSRGKKFDVGFAVWVFDKGKFRDISIERGTAELNKNMLVVNSENGYKLELSGRETNYSVGIEKNGKNIIKINSKSPSVSKGEIKDSMKYTPFTYRFSKDWRSIFYQGHFYQKPHFVIRHSDLYTDFTGIYLKKKMNGIAWYERLYSFSSYCPWKLLLMQFEKGPMISAYWYYGRRFNFSYPPGINVYSRQDKKLYHIKMNKHVYRSSKDGEEYEDLRKDTKFIDIEGRGNKMEIKIKLEFTGKHRYTFKTIFNSKGFYWQFFFKIKELVFKKDGKELGYKNWGNYCAYGEHSYFGTFLGKKSSLNM